MWKKLKVWCHMIFTLPPSPCHKLSHFLRPPPPWSVTYFMDGPLLPGQVSKVRYLWVWWTKWRSWTPRKDFSTHKRFHREAWYKLILSLIKNNISYQVFWRIKQKTSGNLKFQNNLVKKLVGNHGEQMPAHWDLPRWSLLNRFCAAQGLCSACLKRSGQVTSDLCDSGELQTIHLMEAPTTHGVT